MPRKERDDYEEEYSELAREWRGVVRNDLEDIKKRLAQLENFNARAIGWICGIQFVGMGFVALLEYIFKH